MIDATTTLRQTLKEIRKRETFEKALGRIIRKNGGSYEDYIRLIGNVRDLARKRKIDLLEAAKELAGA